MCWRMFPLQYCFLLPSVCSDCVCSGRSSGTGGLDCVLEDVSITMLFSVAWCVATLFAVRVPVGLVACIVCWKIFLILYCFLLPNVCGDCVSSRGSSGTGGLDYVLEDVSNTILFSVA